MIRCALENPRARDAPPPVSRRRDRRRVPHAPGQGARRRARARPRARRGARRARVRASRARRRRRRERALFGVAAQSARGGGLVRRAAGVDRRRARDRGRDRGRARDRDRPVRDGRDRRRAGRRVHRSRIDLAVDAPDQRVRRELGSLHRRRVRADRAPPHAPLRHAPGVARRGRGDDPQPRRAPSRRGVPRPPRDAAGRARVAHGRRSLSPARLRDQLRGRRGSRAHHRRTRAPTSASHRSTCSAARSSARAWPT